MPTTFFRFQPYVLLISCHLTLATFVVISMPGADAEFHIITPLLKHCLMNLVIAFHIKLVQKLVQINEIDELACNIMGDYAI